MKQFVRLRVLPVLLVISFLLPVFVVPASAVEFPELVTIRPEAIFDYDLLQSELKRLINEHDSDSCAFVSSVYSLNNPNNWCAVSKDLLDEFSVYWNYNFQDDFSITTQVAQTVLDDGTAVWFIRAHLKDSVYEGRDALQWCMNDGNYKVLVAPVDSETSSTGIWISEESYEKTVKKKMLSMEELTNLANDVGADLAWNDTFYYIYREDGQLVYADPGGLPYAAFRYPDAFASQTERPGTSAKDENGDETELPEDFDANIDLENMLITLPNGTLAILDSVIYDESTKSYYIDSHDTYNTTNNYYYHWEYHINYTSITYIGQTEEYNKYYEVYYELPDGRDSADLTKEEVEQLNTSVDVIPYGRSTDDTSLRSLYHFDGDTKDASYWNYCTAFTWNTGASLTYMDAAVFEGALYLDENIHDFTLTIPSEIGNDDFTIQFRYYQSYTAAPQTDSYIQSGLYKLLQLSGGYYVDPAGTTLAVTPTGTWNEVAIMRDSGTLYFYNNGVCIGSYADSSYLNNLITFHFGSSQQTYKYLDELRILNYALESGGDSYTPTSVPHDTNLALVLPDSSVPVADEYWDIDFTDTAELSFAFTDNQMSDSLAAYSSKYMAIQSGAHGARLFFTESYASDLELFDDFGPSVSTMPRYFSFNAGSVGPAKSEDYKYYGVSANIILGDGQQYSIRYSYLNDTNPMQYNENGNAVVRRHAQLVEIPNGWLTGFCDSIYLILDPRIDGTVLRAISVSVTGPFSSLSAVTWSDTTIEAEKVASVTAMTPDQLHTPTLAVRTDLDITSYQIGGVRPSVPEKGMVWALVENERITSIQIYNGQAWEGVDGRIWTGSRWIPASSYNIITLQDMYDIVDATPDYEYIYTESGFWSWWQKSWNAFQERLFSVLTEGVGSKECEHVYAVESQTDPTCTESGQIISFCPLCGDRYVEETLPLGHDWQGVLNMEVTGKNLLYRDYTSSTTINGVSISYDPLYQEFILDGTVTSNGDMRLVSPLDLNWTSGDKYTVSVWHTGGSAELASGSGIAFAYSIFASDASKFVRGSLYENAFPELYSYTAKAFDADSYIFYLQCWRVGTVFDNYRIRIQVEAGEDVTDWEPGGELSSDLPNYDTDVYYVCSRCGEMTDRAYSQIQDEADFWDWWQQAWMDFSGKESSGSGASGGDGSSEMEDVDLDAVDPESVPEEEDNKTFWQFVVLLIAGGKSVVSGVRELTSGAVSSVPESMEDIVGAFDSGGMAVGVFDGSFMDPDAADLPQDDSGEAALAEVEEVDPWRYR